MSSPLRQALAEYLQVRRSLGYKLARPEKLLGQFIGCLEQAGAATVTTEHALAWSVLPGGDPSWHAYRLSAVRGFAAWLRTTDPDAQVPPAQLIPSRKLRATPYLYADAEITALIGAAAALRFPLRAATYQTLIGLLAVTGMRVGEAIRLDRGDTGLDSGVLTIREAKHGKTRLIPLHETAVQALRGYLQPSQAATGHRTSSWPSSKRSDYADLSAIHKAAASSYSRQVGIIPRSA
jgi:integrase/recombinase XerD